ncbi:MAG: hypothetical protein GY942_13445 [Aestuariibacter sp.]|nr:hypothetical protein [Aestuariibacter sp.]
MSTGEHEAASPLAADDTAVDDPAVDDTAADGEEVSLGEALLDMLELVSRYRPDLLPRIVEALFSSTVRRVAASVGKKLGRIDREGICKLFYHHAAVVDRLERDRRSSRKVKHRCAEHGRATRILAAVCQARGRNVIGQRRLRLFEIERKLRAEIEAAAATDGEEVAEP